jgi:hypothetical protein
MHAYQINFVVILHEYLGISLGRRGGGGGYPADKGTNITPIHMTRVENRGLGAIWP